MIRSIVAGAMIALLVLTHFTAYRAGRGAVRAEITTRALEDAHELRKMETRRATLAAEADTKARNRERVLARDADAARTESERLRDEIAAHNHRAQRDAEACRRYAAAVTGVLAEMEREGAGLARAADQCVSDLMLMVERP